MDFGALPPEINSARMYSGPGSESMLAAASAWDGLAAELQSTASSYGSVISELTGQSWVGPSSASMEAAATPYVAWLNATAGEAEQTASQARAAAAAYQAAFAMTVPPATILANRTQLASLTATNVFGQNTPAIAANEAQYGEMWAQDATAMYSYAGSSSAASTLTTFAAAPSVANPSGGATQAAAVAQATGTSTGTGVQSTLSQLLSSITTSLQSLASPAASSTSSTPLSTLFSNIESALGLTPSSSTTGGLGGLSTWLSDELPGFSVGGTLTGLVSNYAYLPGFMSIFLANDAIAPALGTAITQAMVPPMAGGAAAAAPLVGGAALGAAAAQGALGPGLAGGLGGLAGLGQAASVGTLSVPQTWGWAATPEAAMLGGMPVTMPLSAANMGATGGLPLAAGLPMMGGMGRAAGVAAAAGVGGAVASRYGKPRRVVARPPAAGYPPEPAAASATAHPAGFVTNGHAPPGYTPAIVYLPTNGQAPPKK